METDDAAFPGFVVSDDLLVFDHLHVDTGPELPDEVTEIHWLFAGGMEVSVHVPIDPLSIASVDLPVLHDSRAAGADWLL
jgi:hypothetical protein